MGESKKTDVARARVRWNDIRVVGPLLVMALLLATLVSPQVATAEQSVGSEVGGGYGGYYPCGYGPDLFKPPPSSTVVAFATADAEAELPFSKKLPGPCCGPIALSATAAVGISLIGDERPFVDPCCAVDSPSIFGGMLSRCGPVEGELFVPVVKRPVPPPIMGPIWLGATQAVSVNGSLGLTPPSLLTQMIDGNYVEVHDADGDAVFAGAMPANGTIVTVVGTATGSGDYTMVTILKTGAVYTEVISFSDS